MRFQATPTPSAVIQVNKSELFRLKASTGLWLKYNDKVYYWLVDGKWILVILKPENPKHE